MGATSELFIKLKEKQIQDEFLNNHIIFCTLKPEGDCDNSP
jgi:hypothetical protein